MPNPKPSSDKERLILSPLPVRERMKVRVRLQRVFVRAIQDSASPEHRPGAKLSQTMSG